MVLGSLWMQWMASQPPVTNTEKGHSMLTSHIIDAESNSISLPIQSYKDSNEKKERPENRRS